MALLDALRALTSFAPPRAIPECDLALLGDVLEAHGLAPMASRLVETTTLGAALPDWFRERLMTGYSGVVNDNLMKVLTLRGVLRELSDLPVVVLDAAAYIDWIYPHLALRPAGDVTLAVRAEDGQRFAERVKGSFALLRTEHEGRTAVFGDDKTTITIQEGLWAGGPADAPLFERSWPYRVLGPTAARPSAEDALLSTIAGQALLGLHAPLVTYVDVRELLRLPLDAAYVKERARALGLARAAYGSTVLAAHYFPEIEDAAVAIRHELGAAERVAVDRVVDAARDPAKLRHVRGADAAARAVVAP